MLIPGPPCHPYLSNQKQKMYNSTNGYQAAIYNLVLPDRMSHHYYILNPLFKIGLLNKCKSNDSNKLCY